MPSITVRVWDATGKQQSEVELPDDAAINGILSVLVERMNLPRYGPNGELLSYGFSDKASGKPLLGDHCLAEAGVRDGDVLRLQPESTAASDGPVSSPAELEPILFRCACGRLTSAPRTSIGKRGRCSRCGQRLRVPPESNTTPISPPSATRKFCGICKMAIGDVETWVRCPKCDRRHHPDCWDQNLGCNTPGCRQADALMPRPVVQNQQGASQSPSQASPLKSGSFEIDPFQALGVAALLITMIALTYWLGDPENIERSWIVRAVAIALKALLKLLRFK